MEHFGITIPPNTVWQTKRLATKKNGFKTAIFHFPFSIFNSPLRAFTTLELLFVITLICLLVGLLTPGVSTLNRNALKRRAQTEIEALAQAIQSYQLEYGVWPGFDESQTDPGARDFDITPLLPSGNPRQTLFITLPDKRLDPGTDFTTYYLDPWGSRYRIQFHQEEPDDPATGFFLYSCGPNKSDDGGDHDDIVLRSF